MKKWFLIISLAASILSCENAVEKSQIVENQTYTKVFDSVKYASQFKYKNLKTFEIDTIQFGEREKYYNKVDSLTFENLFQGHETFLYSNAYFFYANFDYANKVALLEESDEFGVLIWLITFDDKGKFITKSCLQRNTQ
jgi:hypothetical protein